jgi:glycosyltransferase involved in cell wall biosynthesis
MLKTSIPNYDEPVAVLGQRYPLLVHDISQWVQANPASTQVRASAARRAPRLIRAGERALLYDCPDPNAVFGQLESDAKPFVHLFPDVADFLQFLTHPSARLCLTHDRWQPLLLLPLQHANHFRQWLATMRPADWPWALCDERHCPDEPGNRPALAVGSQMRELLKALAKQLAERLRARYTCRPTPRGILIAEVRALRVLALAFAGSSYQQFCARDIAQAFGENGADGRALILKAGPARHYELLKAIDEFDPDILFLNGRARVDFEDLPHELAVVSWDQDYALSTRPDAAERMTPRDRLLLMVSEWAEDARQSGFPQERTEYVNLGVNEKLYHPAMVRPAPPEFDVLFVGKYYPWEKYSRMIHFDTLAPQMQKVMLLARERLTEWVRTRGEEEPFILPDLDRFLHDCCRELRLAHNGDGEDWRIIVNNFRYRIAHLLVREQYVSALAEFKLGLFGAGWDSIPALAGVGQPEIENGAPLRDAIHRSAICLHLHTWTVHHPRLYDTAAAGGFLLVGRVPERVPLQTVFDVGTEVDTFGSIAELKRKVRYYLDHRDQREQMARAAVDRARREHTMGRRMRQVLQFLARDGHEQRAAEIRRAS